MKKTLKWRVILLAGATILAILFFLPSKPITLGLDLQGGMHIVFKVQGDKAVENSVARVANDIVEIFSEKKINIVSAKAENISELVKSKSLMTGDVISDATVSIDPDMNEPFVSITFNSIGAKEFDRITGENVKKRLAIVLDGNVYSAPVIQDRISGGKAQITGRFSMEEAKDLSIVLREGALPAPVEIIQNLTVGPSLGKDSIEKGIKATIIAGILVVLFMAIYYKLSG